MKFQIKHIFLATFLLPVALFAQTITGPTKVGTSQTYRYSFDNGTFLQSPSWSATHASVTNQGSNGTIYYADISFNTTGTWTITLYDQNFTVTVAQKSVTVASCSAISAPTGTNGSVFGPGTVQLSVASNTSYLVRWYSAANPTTILYTSDGDNVYSPSVSATTNFLASYVVGSTGCESPKTTVTATVKPLPTVTGNPMTVCSGGTYNISVTNNFGGTSNAWTVSHSNTSGGSSDNGIADGGGAFSFSQTLNATTTSDGTATYTITPTYDGCAGTPLTLPVTVKAQATNPNAGPDQTGASTCGLTSVTLGGNPITVGTGTWTITSGTGGTINTPGSPTSVFTGVAGNSYTLRWSSTNGSCMNDSPDFVNIAFNLNPTTANAGPDQTGAATCGQTTVTLAANSPAVGTGAWSVVSGSGGSFGNAGSPTSTFTGAAGSTYTLRWTISNSPCNASSDDVVITFNTNPVAAAGPDQGGSATCGLSTVTLNATEQVSPAAGNWSVVSGTGWSFSNQTAANSTFTGVPGRTYVLRWTVSKPPCPSVYDDVTITLSQMPTAAISPSTQTVCSGSSASVTISNPVNPTGTTNAFTYTGTNTTYPTTIGGGNVVSGVFSSEDKYNSGTVTYTVTPSTSLCNGVPVTATLTVHPIPVSPGAGNAIAYGVDNPIFYRLSVPVGLTGEWFVLSTDVTPVGTGSTLSVPPAAPTPTVRWARFKNPVTGCASPKVKMKGQWLVGDAPGTIKTQVVRVADKKTELQIKQLTDAQQFVGITYIDGLSRPVQQVARKASPTQKDIVQPIEYDQFGRSAKTYLPYTDLNEDAFRENYASEQHSFYLASDDKIANDDYAYAKTVYEASPLGRPKEIGKFGQTWQPGSGHNTMFAYSMNASDNIYRINADPVMLGSFVANQTLTSYDASNSIVEATNSITLSPNFTTAGASFNAIIRTNAQQYADNSLMRVQKTDENGNVDISFIDGLGRTLVRKQQLDENIGGTLVNYLETYYVYDDFNQLRYILPPGAVAALKANSWNFTQTLLDDQAHQFVYDNRGRVTQKKTPGQAWTYFVYDKMNRIVMVQDGNLRPLYKWAFVKYDIRGRAVISGLYKNTTETTLAGVQAIVDGQYGGSAPYYELRGTAMQGYTNQSFPTLNRDNTALEILSVNYFDNYDFDNNNNADFTFDSNHLAGIATAKKYLKGMPTGSRKLILGTSNWLVSAVFYDTLGRVIQAQGNNHKNLSALDKSSVVYDFEGKVVQSKNSHDGGTQVSTLLTPQYDLRGAMIGVKHKIGDTGADQLLVNYVFNELGQVVKKQLHRKVSYETLSRSNYVQNVDYRYSINGWLSSINNSELTSDSIKNNDTNDYFGMELVYDATDAVGNSPLFNGNVTATKWKSIGAGNGATDQKSYKYMYDKTDKLLTATFQKFGGAWNKEQNTLNETMTYDHNGNIINLIRNENLRGLSGTTVTSAPQAIDNLTYTYGSPNKLTKVSDATARATGFKDDNNAQSTEYNYDTHGNLTSDLNKGIQTIVYNELGKAKQISFLDGRVINYTYDAGGNKLTMATTVNSVTTTTDYVNGFVYTNGNLAFFGSPEGRVVKNGSNYEYQYAISDHQGNTRVVFTSNTPTPVAKIATFEGNSGDNSSEFTNVSNVYSFTSANNTPGGNMIVRMNQNYSVGPAKSLKVYPGDAVDMEVYAYYESASGYGTTNVSTSAMILNIASGLTGGMAAGPDKTALTNGINAGLGGFGIGGNQGDNVPAAYLNYILFDANYNPIDAGWQAVTSASNFSKQKVSLPTKQIKEAGYIYVYLSYENQSNNYVYFDDFKVTHTPTNVIQYNEYYPFGLQTASSWTRENNSNNFLYNEGSEMNATSGLYDLPFRNYDAALGRFFQVDPLSHMDHDYSPFAYGRNNPIVFNDPSGLMVSVDGYSDSQIRSMYRRDRDIGGYSGSFGEWAQDNLSWGGGANDRKVVGTDGKTYGVDEHGRMGTYTVDEVGYYSYTSTDGGKTWTNSGWTTDHVEVNFHPMEGAEEGPGDQKAEIFDTGNFHANFHGAINFMKKLPGRSYGFVMKSNKVVVLPRTGFLYKGTKKTDDYRDGRYNTSPYMVANKLKSHGLFLLIDGKWEKVKEMIVGGFAEGVHDRWNALDRQIYNSEYEGYKTEAALFGASYLHFILSPMEYDHTVSPPVQNIDLKTIKIK